MINNKWFLLCLLFVSTIISSCKNTPPKEEIDRLKFLYETLEKSSIAIQQSSLILNRAINENFKDPQFTHVIAHIEEMNQYIFKRSNDLIGEIKGTRKILYENAMRSKNSFASKKVVYELNEKTNFYNELYKIILSYKTDIIGRDSGLMKYFGRQEIVPGTLSQKAFTNEFFFNLLFKDKTAIEALVNLCEIENRVAEFENSTLSYYFNNYSRDVVIIDEQYSLLVGQSKEEVKAGSTLKISAGIGVFTSRINSVKIGDKEAKPDNGFTETTINVSKIPGKYSVPVEIEYTEPDGRKVTKTETIKYTVVE